MDLGCRAAASSAIVCHRLLIAVNSKNYSALSCAARSGSRTGGFSLCGIAFRTQPDRLGGRAAKNGAARRQLNRDGLVVVLAGYLELLAGADSGPVEKEQQLGVALLQTGDGVPASFDGFWKRNFAAALAIGWIFRQHGVAVRAGAFAELFL